MFHIFFIYVQYTVLAYIKFVYVCLRFYCSWPDNLDCVIYGKMNERLTTCRITIILYYISICLLNCLKLF